MPSNREREELILRITQALEDFHGEGIDACLSGIESGRFSLHFGTNRVPKDVVEKLATKWPNVRSVQMYPRGGGSWVVTVTFDYAEGECPP